VFPSFRLADTKQAQFVLLAVRSKFKTVFKDERRSSEQHLHDSQLHKRDISLITGCLEGELKLLVWLKKLGEEKERTS
jgi:hypothetical protein